MPEPYLSFEELTHETEAGVKFWCCKAEGTLAAVMGIQEVQDVSLIRHAYVRSASRNQGIGGRLLTHLLKMINGTVQERMAGH